MTECIVFETPTVMDLRAITIMGVNSKPNSDNPIGYFGTGLKYAIAILVREGIEPELRINDEGTEVRYKFAQARDEFRGKTFTFIHMFRESIRKNGKRAWLRKPEVLPFTTELGKNWELWQAFRELYSNTVDEGGSTFESDTVDNTLGEKYTAIVVPGEAFLEEFKNRGDTFLTDEEVEHCQHSTEAIEYIDRPSQYVYYRGLRVMELPKPSIVTWNLLDNIDLTEDRTVKYTWEVDNRIRSRLRNSTDSEFIEKILNADDHYEESLNFNDGVEVSEVFRNVAAYSSNASAVNCVRELEEEEEADEELEAFKNRPWKEQALDMLSRDYVSKYELAVLFEAHSIEVIELLENAIKAEESEESEKVLIVDAPATYADTIIECPHIMEPTVIPFENPDKE